MSIILSTVYFFNRVFLYMSAIVPDSSETTTILPCSPSHLDRSRETWSSDLQKRIHQMSNLLVSLTEGNILKLSPWLPPLHRITDCRRFVVLRRFADTNKWSYVKLYDEDTKDVYELRSDGINARYATITLYSRLTKQDVTFYWYIWVDTDNSTPWNNSNEE